MFNPAYASTGHSTEYIDYFIRRFRKGIVTNPSNLCCMLDHPITVVLNGFWHWKATGFKVSKFMGIQNQEWERHIGYVKQLKSDRYQDRIFFLKLAFVHPYFPKK